MCFKKLSCKKYINDKSTSFLFYNKRITSFYNEDNVCAVCKINVENNCFKEA